MNSEPAHLLKKKYPWLFLDKPISVDIIYDLYEPEEDDDPREVSAVEDTIKTAKQLQAALISKGHTVSITAVGHQDYQDILPNVSGDIVFNQVEEDELGFKVLSLLESLKKPVTGVDSSGWTLSWNKELIKETLINKHIPTPKHFILNETSTIKTNLNYPLFVKAANDHGSLSINQNSVVNDKQQLISQVNWI